MSFKRLITSCMPFMTPLAHPPETPSPLQKSDSANNRENVRHINGTHDHFSRFKEKIVNSFKGLFPDVHKSEVNSMKNKVVINLPTPPPYDSSPTDQIHSSATFQAVQAIERQHENGLVRTNVVKGLKKAVEYCQARDKLYGNAEFSEILFHDTDIPPLASLETVIQHYTENRGSWTHPIHVTNADWPCSIIADKDRGYLLFPLVIGEGGKKAGIYLGMDLSTGENVVISKIENQFNKDFKTLFFPEYMMGKLTPLSKDEDKGGILPLRHIFNLTTGSFQQQFLVQKLCKQGNLLTYLSSGVPLTPKQKKRIADDIFNALYALHQNQILHKDIKPENIFLDIGSDGKLHAYLGDFDYLSSIRNSFHNNPEFIDKVTTVGSFPYLPPETIIEGYYDAKSEVYGLGLILYSLFSGSPPKVVQELESKGQGFKYTVPRFNSWNPWFRKDPETKGSRLVSKMICTEPDERHSMKEARDEYLKIPIDQLLIDSSTGSGMTA